MTRAENPRKKRQPCANCARINAQLRIIKADLHQRMLNLINECIQQLEFQIEYEDTLNLLYTVFDDRGVPRPVFENAAPNGHITTAMAAEMAIEMAEKIKADMAEDQIDEVSCELDGELEELVDIMPYQMNDEMAEEIARQMAYEVSNELVEEVSIEIAFLAERAEQMQGIVIDISEEMAQEVLGEIDGEMAEKISE